MTQLDAQLAGLGSGWLFVAVLAGLLGLRHAADPDHLTAVLTLRLRSGRQQPFGLGLAWGLGHAVTMIAIGVPLILFVARLPERIQQGLEVAVGVLIVVLAIRVLWGLTARRPEPAPARTPHGAFMIGLLHGAAGSAGIVALILSRLDDPALACASLVVIAAFCALSMGVCSWAICRGLDHGERRLDARWIAGAGGVLALGFGVLYAVTAAG